MNEPNPIEIFPMELYLRSRPSHWKMELKTVKQSKIIFNEAINKACWNSDQRKQNKNEHHAAGKFH